MQTFFKESSGATLLDTKLQTDSSIHVVSSAIIWKDADGQEYVKIKVLLSCDLVSTVNDIAYTSSKPRPHIVCRL